MTGHRADRVADARLPSVIGVSLTKRRTVDFCRLGTSSCCARVLTP